MEREPAVQFDTEEWEPERTPDGTLIFVRPPGDVLVSFEFLKPPDIPGRLDELDALRAGYRQMIAGVGAGIIAIDVVPLDEVPSVVMLIKVPQQPTGMAYLASITVPFRDRSYVIKVQCPEVGMTGMRDTLVYAKRGMPPGDDPFAGWAADPYDPSFAGPALRNQADDEAWDPHFPDHPLSRARRHLAALTASVRVASWLKTAPPFTGPSAAPGAR